MTIINKHLEAAFNLAPITTPDEDLILPDDLQTKEVSLKEVDEVSASLSEIYGNDTTDKELDELANLAIQAHKDLMEQSFAVEQRFAEGLAIASANMLGHAIAARTNKIKKKLDVLTIKIKKQLADAKTKTADNVEVSSEEGIIMNRNELLEHLLNNPK
jgi:hypothetical protein